MLAAFLITVVLFLLALGSALVRGRREGRARGFDRGL